MSTRGSSAVGKQDASSCSDEITTIKNDLRTLNENVKKKPVKSDDLETLISSIVKKVQLEHKSESDEKEKILREKITKLEHNRDRIEGENIKLRELLADSNKKVRELEKSECENEILAKNAMKKSNYNEQYSRKNNIKIQGVPENRNENTLKVAQDILKEKGNVELKTEDVIAIHRIPGKKIILIKLKNTECKSIIMRKKSVIKKAQGNVKLVDDVSELNGKLITRLINHDQIDSAWYFNGRVFGQVNGKRIMFDLYDNVDEKVCSKPSH
ncbi:hypothetical protein FSP39_024704 [Pinctada imbricata]|uniref:Uncharacterized protein n=1 Tax=Pinctada imbricata TaxID=66713 RepID=A0AA88Y8V2_PINIB|nr:hypothetical protein FSP39_024704 [Pinctada imbricata]